MELEYGGKRGTGTYEAFLNHNYSADVVNAVRSALFDGVRSHDYTHFVGVWSDTTGKVQLERGGNFYYNAQ